MEFVEKVRMMGETLFGDPKIRVRSGAALVVALLAFYVRKLIKFFLWRRKIISSFKVPKSSFLLGNLIDIVRISGGFSEAFFEWLHYHHGPVVGFFIGPNFNVSISDPKNIEEVYKQTSARPYSTYRLLRYLGNDNLLFAKGNDAEELRLQLQDMISTRVQLLRLHRISLDEVNKRTLKWGNFKGLDLFQELSATLYDINGQILFGRDWIETEAANRIYRLHNYLVSNTNRFVLPGSTLVLLPFFLNFLRIKRKWRNAVGKLVKQHEKYTKNNSEKSNENEESIVKMILTVKNAEGKQFFSRHRTVSILCSFLDSSLSKVQASAYWLFYHLALFPEKQQKLRQQIRKVIGGSTTPTLEESQLIEYLQAFIYESLRLKTTVTVNQRISYENDISCGDFVVPKGTCVNIPQSICMRSTEYFGIDAEEFKPERFLPNNPGYKKAMSAWTVFGMYTRKCIGSTFALTQLRNLLIVVLQQYRVEFVDSEYNGVKCSEAGVNQPQEKARFRFIPSTIQIELEQLNREWWEKPVGKRLKNSLAKAA